MITTAEALQAAYHALDPTERQRFDRAHGGELGRRLGRYRRCVEARRERVDRRNRLLHALIVRYHLPTATLEDWRRARAEVQRIDTTALTRGRYVSARGLRAGYLPWLQTHLAALAAAA